MIKKTLQNSQEKTAIKNDTDKHNNYVYECIKNETENKNGKNGKNGKYLPKVFACKSCDYYAKRFCDYQKHIDTIKHRNKILLTKNKISHDNTYSKQPRHILEQNNISYEKSSKSLCCKHCNYHTNRIGDFKKHLTTLKHISNQTKNDIQNYTCICGKTYKFQSGFSRHKKTCVYHKHSAPVEKTETAEMQSSNVVTMLREMMNENKKLHEQMMIVQSENNSTLRTMIPKIGNTTNTNSHNKIVNVQMFLEERCQHAMTIQNFADKLMVSMDDLVKNKKDCITNVVLKNLRPLSLTERPFHCANAKSKEWYIKDETQGWEEDNGEKLLKNTEAGIQKKWLDEFETLYPNWMLNESLQEKYVKIAGSTTYELPEVTKLKILKELGREVPLTSKELQKR